MSDTHTHAVEFVHRAHRAFAEAAARATGVIERRFRIGGRVVAMQFAGPALEPLMTASLEHLEIDVDAARAPDLTICLWDTQSTGIDPPGFPGGRGDPSAGEVRYCFSPRVKMCIPIQDAALQILDLDAHLSIYWVDRPERVAVFEIAEPVRLILGWWAPSFGGQLAHGAAVGRPQGGVLLVGSGGSGKSTTALACLEAGMQYAGDDYVLLADDERGPAVHTLYNTAKLSPDHLEELVPWLSDSVEPDLVSSRNKVIVHIHRSHPERLIERMPVRAIVVPRVSPEGRIDVRRIPPIAVFKALAPTSAMHFPGSGQQAMQMLGRFVQRVPGYALDLAPDLDRVVACVESLMNKEAGDAI